MEDSRTIIRFEIRGVWTAEEMGRSLLHLHDLYNLRLVLQVLHENYPHWLELSHDLLYAHEALFPLLRKRRIIHRKRILKALSPFFPNLPLQSDELALISDLIHPQGRLEVRRIHYGSPGSKDLVGAGEIVKHIKDFILKIFDYSVSKEDRDLDRQKARQDIAKKKIENLREFTKLLEELNYNKAQIRRATGFLGDRHDTFADFIENGKITNVITLPKKKKSQIDGGRNRQRV